MTQQQVINLLRKSRRQMSAREIKEKVKVCYSACQHNLAALVKQGEVKYKYKFVCLSKYGRRKFKVYFIK